LNHWRVTSLNKTRWETPPPKNYHGIDNSDNVSIKSFIYFIGEHFTRLYVWPVFQNINNSVLKLLLQSKHCENVFAMIIKIIKNK